MSIKKAFGALAIAGTMLLTGCAGNYSSYDPSCDGEMEVNYSMTLETGNTLDSVGYAKKLANDMKGTVNEQDVSKEYASLVVEVPANSVEEFIDKLDDKGDKVKDISNNGQVYETETEYDGIVETTVKSEPKSENTSTIYIYYNLSALTMNFENFKYALSHVFEVFANMILVLATALIYLVPYNAIVAIIVYFATRKSRKKHKEDIDKK